MTIERLPPRPSTIARLAAYAAHAGLTLEQLADELGRRVGIIPLGKVPPTRPKGHA